MKHRAAVVKRQVLFLFLIFVLFIPFSNAADFFFDSAGVKIHYTVEGKGEPVLLIHGFGGDAQSNWSEAGVIKELSEIRSSLKALRLFSWSIPRRVQQRNPQSDTRARNQTRCLRNSHALTRQEGG